jgi:tol-pal system protein YbgF
MKPCGGPFFRLNVVINPQPGRVCRRAGQRRNQAGRYRARRYQEGEPMVRVNLFISVGAAVMLALLAPAHAQTGAPQSALDTQMRMNTLEDQMRQLTGQLEELNNTVAQLKQQLDLQKSDTDLRFSQLQGGGAPPPDNSGGQAVEGPPQPKPPPGAGADVTQPASRSGNLGALASPNPPAPAPAQAPTQTAAAGAGALPAGNAQDQYNYAMGLLTQANYPAAEQAMRAFVQRYPKDSLAGNAQYWLGETFYVRKDYSNAATAFAQGYEKYPKGQKASDDLLKLGMSLTALNQKPDACKAYARLEHDFPSPGQSIKDRLTEEKHRASC